MVRWLAENSAGSNRRLRAEIDKVIYRPGQPVVIAVQAFDEEARPTDSYRVIARIRRPDPASQSRPADFADSIQEDATRDLIASVELTPNLADHTYRGELPAPSAGTILENPGSTLQTLRLEVIALDGERHVAQTSIDLQLLDDPAEFLDPRPDPEQLSQLAKSTGGRVLRSPEELADLLTRQARGRPDADLAKTGLGPCLGLDLAARAACERVDPPAPSRTRLTLLRGSEHSRNALITRPGDGTARPHHRRGPGGA